MNDRATPPKPSLEQELRSGLHVERMPSTRNSTGGEVTKWVRCAQAAMLRIADELHDADKRRANDVQRIHDRISTIEAQVRKIDDSTERRAAQRDLRDLQQAIREASHRIAVLELQAAEARGRLEGSNSRPMTMAQLLDTLLKAGAVLVFALGSAWAFVELVVKSGG